MLICGSEAVTNHSWLPSSAWRFPDSLGQNGSSQEEPELLDEVPVMLATVLGLNMLLQEPSIDLQRVSELILNDVGATIKMLRLVGKESDWAAEHPRRMVDCIASLEVDAWFGPLSARTFSCDLEHSAMSEFWEHSRLVAQYAQLVAESIDDICPEDAYLVGLLHGTRELPSVLRWSDCGRDAASVDALAAIEGTLPPFVLTGLQSGIDSTHPSSWSVILTAAHELASIRLDYRCAS